MATGSLYMKVSRTLERELRTKGMGTGQVLPSERELAIRFGVSTITVRQALAHLERAGKIYRVPKVGTFAGPRPRGGPMRRPGRISVALMVPMLKTGIGPMILAGVEDTCLRNSVYVEVYHSRNSMEVERQQLTRLMEGEVDGAIIMSYDPRNIESIIRLKLSGLPIVIVVHEVPGVMCDFVTAENRAGGRMAGARLRGHNPRHYVHVTMDTMVSTSEDRYLGFREDLLSAGLADPLVIRYSGENKWLEGDSVKRSCVPVLRRLTPPVGIFCHNDYSAVGVYQAADELGWKVGRDVFVVGFDDDPICLAMAPTLTTICQSGEAIGSRAAEMLLDRLKGKVGADELRRESLPVEMVIRESA